MRKAILNREEEKIKEERRELLQQINHPSLTTKIKVNITVEALRYKEKDTLKILNSTDISDEIFVKLVEEGGFRLPRFVVESSSEAKLEEEKLTMSFLWRFQKISPKLASRFLTTLGDSDTNDLAEFCNRFATNFTELREAQVLCPFVARSLYESPQGVCLILIEMYKRATKLCLFNYFEQNALDLLVEDYRDNHQSMVTHYEDNLRRLGFSLKAPEASKLQADKEAEKER